MKMRNYMCIFALCAIVIGFFAFGAVANAEEAEKETFSYQLSYSIQDNDKIIYDTIVLEYRICAIPVRTFTQNGFDYIDYEIDFYNESAECLYSLSNKNLYVDYTYIKDGVSNRYNRKVSDFFNRNLVTDIPIFENTEDGKAAALDYLKTGKLPEEIEDTDMDAPKLVFTDKGGLTFKISNAVDSYFVEMQGRNYSVDDVELYKENAMWKYKYQTILKNALTTWISSDSKISSTSTFNLAEYGKTSVSELNSRYPVDKRSYSGGTNALGNKLSGYSDALAQFKTLCQTQGSLYCGTEIYIRFVYKDSNGDIHYSKWTHWFDNLANASGSSGSKMDDKDNIDNGNHSDVGLSDEEKKKLEDSDNSRDDTDAKPIRIEPTSPVDGLFKDLSPTNILTYFVSLIKTLLSATSNIAPFFNNIFGFLPAELRNVVYVTISAGCFCALIRFIFGKG